MEWIGRRVLLHDSVCTVRYIGPITIPNSLPDREYWGVEFDDPERGKHDGMGYFTTVAPNAAVFVIPDKVFSGIDLV